METRTVLIHGWSDCSEGFKEMKRFLHAKGFGPLRTIYYADYESREDNLTFHDVVDGLHQEFMRHGFIDGSGNGTCRLNVIVHSTGGLVIRHWIWRYYARDGLRIEDCPVKRIVMLAPANFGSPLAHRGKSFFGALAKGRWKIGDFLETGRQILSGLELASPYQWRLALDDVLRPDGYFGFDGIQLTILIGVEGYQGIQQLVNKRGTDGVVVIAGANLDCLKLDLDFTRPRQRGRGPYQPAEWPLRRPGVDTAFAVLPGLDHGSIVNSVKLPGDGGDVGRLMVEALQVTEESGYQALQQKCRDLTASVYAASGDSSHARHQQFLVHAVDDQGADIDDFTLEFFLQKNSKLDRAGVAKGVRRSHAEETWSDRVHQLITDEFHRNLTNPSYRRFLVNVEQVKQHIASAAAEIGPCSLCMRMHVPDIDRSIRYRTEDTQSIVVSNSAARGAGPDFFYPNTTTLVELKVDRVNDYVTVGTTPRSL